jgi:hypothetical protein
MLRSIRSATSDSSLERVRVRTRCFGQLALGLLGGFLEALQGHAVLSKIDAVLPLELFGDPVHDPLVEVVPTQVRVTVGRLDLHYALADLEDGDVEGAAAQVVHGYRLVLLLVQAVGQRGRGRLVDDTQDLEARDGPGVLRSLALAVVEVGGHCDDRLGHLLAQVRLGRLLELAQHQGRDLGRRIHLAPALDARIPVLRLQHLVGHQLDLPEDFVVAPTHEAFDREDRVLWVGDGLTLRHLTHEGIALLREGHHRGGQAAPFLVGDNGGIATFHHRNHRVRRSEVNADHLRHIVFSPVWVSEPP